MRISDWRSDVSTSDLSQRRVGARYGRQCLTEEIAMGRSGVAHELSGQDPGVLGKPRNQSGLLFSSDQMMQGSCISFPQARKSVVSGKRVSFRVVLGGLRLLTNQIPTPILHKLP